MKLCFEKIQENGDATSSYDVTFYREATVDDFCDAVLARSIQQQEQGKIYISEPGDPWHATISEFQYSVMEFFPDYEKYQNKIVKSAWANGRYGAMTYWITL